MGGIGKSVLAAAAAQELAGEFPGGVFWVPVGSGADCLALLRALADAVGLVGSDLISIPQGRDRLRRRFAGEQVLLVLDDVWRPEEAAALDVVDSPGRQLLTSRNAGLLSSLGGEVIRIEILEPGPAIALLAAWGGEDPAALPAAARTVAEECGRLPLALALAGALARKVGRWDDVLRLLRRADLGHFANEWLPDYPYRDLLRALAASVEALEASSRERYLELAVFPEDAAIPEGAIATLWSAAGLDPERSRELVGELAERSLLRREVEGRVTLHDLQHNYLRHQTTNLPGLHERLVEAYRARSPGGFGSGPDDGWFFRRIAWHLSEAGRESELRALLFSFPFLLARLRRGDANGALQDLDLLGAEPAATALQAALRQGMHILAVDPAQLAGQLLGRLAPGEDPKLDDLLQEAEGWRGASWLRPLHPLPPPSYALLRTLMAGDNLRALAALDERRIASASDAGLELWDLETGERLRAQQEEASTLAVVDRHTVAYRGAAGRLGLWDVEANRLTPLAVKASRLRSLRAALSPQSVSLRVIRLALRVLASHRYRYFFPAEGLSIAALGDDRLALARPDGSVQVVEIRLGRTKAVLPGLLTPASSLQQLDERHLGIASTYGEIGVWDLGTGRLVRVHRLARDRILLSRDVRLAARWGSPLLAATNKSGSFLVWNWQSGETLLEDGRSDFLRGLAWLDEHRLATLSQDHTLRIWEARTRSIVFELTHAQLGYPEALARAGRLLVSAGRDGDVRAWDIARLLESCERDQDGSLAGGVEDRAGRSGPDPGLDESRVLPRYRGVIAIASLDEHRSAAATYDGRLQIWDTDTARLLSTFHTGLGNVPAVCAIGADRLALFRDQTLQLWSLDGRHEDHPVDVSYGTQMVALENGELVVVSAVGALVLLSPQGAVREVHPLASGERAHVESIKAAGNRIVFTLYGEPYLYFRDAGGADGAVPLDFFPGKLTPYHGRWGVDIKEDKRGGQESGLAVVDLETASVVHRWSRPSGLITELVSLGPGRLASLATDHTLRVWDAERGRLLASFGFDIDPSALAASPDGSRIFVGDREGRLHVLTLVEGEGAIEHQRS
jgi:WD40 repeat protein